MNALDYSLSPAYDDLAPAYDLLTAGYRHDLWLAAIERLATRCGLRGRSVLDVACGTGKSFIPLLERGYQVTACDVSPAMVAEARKKAAGRATVYVADMRCLDARGPYDLVTCLDDAINHLEGEDEVLATFRAIRNNLAPGGLLVFDVNTLAAYRASGDMAAEDAEHVVVWRGQREPQASPGHRTRVLVDVFARLDGDVWRRTTTEQSHRHYPVADIERLLGDAGLEVVTARGQRPGARLDREVDEERHAKALFVARRAYGRD
jgi:SAM-dependent methyltransferase